MVRHIKNELICQKLKIIEEYEKIKKKESKYFKNVKEICKFYGISRKTFYKWLKRYYDSNKDPTSLLPRSKRPKRNRNMPTKETERIIVKIRKRLGYSGHLISVILRKKGLSRISEFGVYRVFLRYKTGPKYEKRNKKEGVKFYEKKVPWELIHIDDKKTKNVRGESPKQKRYSFKAVDDFTRFKITREYPDKTAKSASDFLRYVVNEIKKIDSDAIIGSVLTDNGKAYTCRTGRGRENHLFEKTCKELGIKHRRTKIRRPQTNGKVEYTHWLYDKEFYRRNNFISFKDREEKLREFTKYLNYTRPHMVLGGLTPYERLLKTKNQKILTKESNYHIKNSIKRQGGVEEQIDSIKNKSVTYVP